ncbi:hypothetical protein PG996_008855 [Apiospora saccharicola]|uniref:Uncharacterized protein n=1 Tax=Apiospora saccharicola TaxID=335842 RepID=A0ABR1V2H2_9PEZI
MALLQPSRRLLRPDRESARLQSQDKKSHLPVSPRPLLWWESARVRADRGANRRSARQQPTERAAGEEVPSADFAAPQPWPVSARYLTGEQQTPHLPTLRQLLLYQQSVGRRSHGKKHHLPTSRPLPLPSRGSAERGTRFSLLTSRRP